jgi:uncharacterized protein (TIGR00255 family)
MTAYGRSFFTSPLGRWAVEIHSVNKKTLDFNLFTPREFLRFDLEIRKWLSESISRGQVTVKVAFHPSGGASLGGAERLLQLKKGMQELAKELSFPVEQITFPFFYEEAKFFLSDIEEQEQQIRQELKQAIEEALQNFLLMREVEGKTLAAAFLQHLKEMRGLLAHIETNSSGIEEKYRKKLLDKLSEVKEIAEEDKDRVLREVFLYAEKVDVTEEIIRLKSHIDQFETLLLLKEKSVGRTMDFLIQEMGREINTICSKSGDLDISFSALKMKSELEKIREQAGNVE